MPRVNLLIADDVGPRQDDRGGAHPQGAPPAPPHPAVCSSWCRRALRLQWRDELQEKFALPFEIVDRRRTENLRRELGIDANPWRSFSRIVASYHYLRQPDIQEQFLAASRTGEDSPHLPWDLLIVDEVPQT